MYHNKVRAILRHPKVWRTSVCNHKPTIEPPMKTTFSFRCSSLQPLFLLAEHSARIVLFDPSPRVPETDVISNFFSNFQTPRRRANLVKWTMLPRRELMANEDQEWRPNTSASTKLLLTFVGRKVTDYKIVFGNSIRLKFGKHDAILIEAVNDSSTYSYKIVHSTFRSLLDCVAVAD